MSLTATKPAPQGTAYVSGRRLEYAVKARLEANDWFVMRSYASKGPVDLLAIKAGQPAWFVQAKRRIQLLGSSEHNNLLALAALYGAEPILATKASERTLIFYRLTGVRKHRSRSKEMEEVLP